MVGRRGSIEDVLSEDDMRSLLLRGEGENTATEEEEETDGVTTGDEFEDAVMEAEGGEGLGGEHERMLAE